MNINELRKLHDDLCLKFHAEAVEKSNHVIDEAYGYYNSESFMYSVPASRNIYQSKIYFQILNYLVLTKLWESQNLNVTVDSLALKRSLESYAHENKVNAKIFLDWRAYMKVLLKIPVRFLLVLVKLTRIRSAAKKISCSISEVQCSPRAVFVNSYMLGGAFNEGGYSNRYFGSFFDFFTVEEKKRTFIVPNFLPVSNIKRVTSEILAHREMSGYKIFCKESFLSISDYFQIFSKWIYSFLLAFKEVDIPFFCFVTEELKLKAFSEITFESLVNVYFMKKLKTANFPIATFISWTENHLYDRALAKGFADNSLPFQFKAYQSVVLDADYDFYIKPTKTELLLRLFPANIYVAGGALLSKDFFGSQVRVFAMPVFRMKSYIGARNVEKENVPAHDVLIGLSLVPNLSEQIMIVATELAKVFPEFNFKVRCHPLLEWPLPEGIVNMSYDFEKDVVVSFRKAALFVSTGSALVLEAALVGVPTLIVRPKGEFAQNPLPLNLRDAFTKIVTIDSDLRSEALDAINISFEVKQKRDYISDIIYSNYVKPISREKFEALIG